MPHKRQRDYESASLSGACRIRTAFIPGQCRNFIAEYISQDDKARQGKPSGIADEVYRKVQGLQRLEPIIYKPKSGQRKVQAPKVTRFNGELRYSA